MNLRHLEIFNAIMSSSSLTEAARRLNVSQPAVSTMLKHTESQLGIKLFQRIGGRLYPTPEAQVLFADVEGIFARIATLERVAQNLRDGRTGALTVAATSTLANTLLPKAIARFRQTRPRVRLQIESLPTDQVVARVSKRESDLGLIYAQVQDGGTESVVIGRTRVACVMRRDHPMAWRPEIGPGDLGDQDIITYGPGTPMGSLIEQCFARSGRRLQTVTEVSFSLTACFIANEGHGVALIDPVISLSGTFPGLVVKPFVPEIEIELRLLFPRDRPRSRLTAQFADMVIDAAADLRAQLA